MWWALGVIIAALSDEVRELLFQAGQAASHHDINIERINRRLDAHYNESNETRHRVDSIEINERLERPDGDL